MDEQDSLNDDVFGTSPHEETPLAGPGPRVRVEPSDVPRLRALQNTAGYREGIAAAKSSVAQDGFDEGYPLGAAIGLEAGLVFGLVQGLLATIKKQGEGAAARGLEAARLEQLVSEARQDLGPRSMFSPNFWQVDGNWKYEVPGTEEQAPFEHVAKNHPIIQKWEILLKSEEDKWGIARDMHQLRNSLDETHTQALIDEKKQGNERREKLEPNQPLEW
ncbi:hypothetical protein MKZ38_009212 [Zalerion maritima]|uniref:Protein YAE1 n=1 Tax=Zalerion maritima TaxID=339359 RepID=A0AAD5WM54_9PEZI|nr:hypothetical protein MKZ38_009212 [Zalerion maritima]